MLELCFHVPVIPSESFIARITFLAPAIFSFEQTPARFASVLSSHVMSKAFFGVGTTFSWIEDSKADSSFATAFTVKTDSVSTSLTLSRPVFEISAILLSETTQSKSAFTAFSGKTTADSCKVLFPRMKSTLSAAEIFISETGTNFMSDSLTTEIAAKDDSSKAFIVTVFFPGL